MSWFFSFSGVVWITPPAPGRAIRDTRRVLLPNRRTFAWTVRRSARLALGRGPGAAFEESTTEVT